MFYHLAAWFHAVFPAFNIFHYVSFRAMAALLSSLGLSLAFGRWFIYRSGDRFRSQVRQYTPDSHQAKNNLPTMGGLYMLATVGLTTMLWANVAQPVVWIFLLCLAGFGGIGAWDDWRKIHQQSGIAAKHKFFLQLVVAGVIVMLWLWLANPSTEVIFPLFKRLHFDLGWFFVPWAMFVLIAMSNGVNLTDGLDGLATTSLLSNFATFSLISYLAGHVLFAQYLHVPFAGSAELAIVGMTLVGTCLGFLWYNTYPAQLFMGDVGALSLGAGLGLLGLMTKQELLLVISGGLFVIETLSVIMQVVSFRCLGRGIFKMAPIHHHFELLGWQESKITVRFGIISLILCLLALMTLKIR